MADEKEKQPFLKRLYNAFRGQYEDDHRTLTLDEVRRLYGPAYTLGAPDNVHVAMDAQLDEAGIYTLIQHSGQLGQAPLTQFVGYGMLQQMSQNGLLRACIETVADDSTRE